VPEDSSGVRLSPDDLRGAVISAVVRHKRSDGEYVVVFLDRQNARRLELRFYGVVALAEPEPLELPVLALEESAADPPLRRFRFLSGDRASRQLELVAREMRLVE
jgi:hypothetical protein